MISLCQEGKGSPDALSAPRAIVPFSMWNQTSICCLRDNEGRKKLGRSAGAVDTFAWRSRPCTVFVSCSLFIRKMARLYAQSMNSSMVEAQESMLKAILRNGSDAVN